MKTPSEQLFRLIRSMSPAEKRYLKKEKDSEGKTNQTLELFDLINEQENYDEEAIKEKMSGWDVTFVKNLKIHKNRLQQLILKSLRSQHEESNTVSRIHALMGDIDILLSRQLFDLAYQAITKAKELCVESESYEQLLQILGTESRWMSTFKDYSSADENAMTKMEECSEIISNYIKYAKINQTILAQANTDGSGMYFSRETERMVHTYVEELIMRPNLQPLSFIARRMHNHIFSIWFTCKGDYIRAYEYTLSSIVQFENNPRLIEEKPVSYLSCLVNHVLMAIQSKKREDLAEWIKKGQGLADKYRLLNLKVYLFFGALNLYIFEHKYEEGYVYWEQQIKPYLAQTESVSVNSSYLIRLQMVTVCLVLGKKEETGNILWGLVGDKTPVVADYLQAAQLLELVFHTEQNDMDFVTNLSTNHLKRLQRNKEHLPFFKFMLTFFRKISDSVNLKSTQKLIEQHRFAHTQYTNERLYRIFTENFCYDNWLEARYQGKSLYGWNREREKTV